MKIYNGKIITPTKIVDGGSVLVTDNTITAVSEKNIEVEDAVEIDAKGNYVSPGFIDIHVHGGGGQDFMDATEFGKYVRSKGVLPSIAHTEAVYDEALSAFENGYTLVTHLYSAMSGVTRKNAFRFAGVVEAAYLVDELDVEIIADGIHLPAPLLKLVYKIKGADRTALITDAMRAAAMPPGESVLGNIHNGIRVIVEDDVAKLPDRSSFAGSVATADRLVRTMIRMAEVPIMDVIKMITATPARILDVSDKKGELTAGKDADIVIFDNEINTQMTIINGKIIYRRE